MTHHVLREKIEENRENVFFYKERRVGFYQFTNIKSETIVNAIKDALLRFNLQPENCKGQTYHGASNMLSKNIATAKRITAENNYCSLLGSFFKFGSKTSDLFVRCFRRHNEQNWWNMCSCNVFTEKRKLVNK